MKKTFELTSQHIVPVSYQHLCSFILKHGPDSFCKVVNGISVKNRFHRVNIIKHIDFNQLVSIASLNFSFSSTVTDWYAKKKIPRIN